MADTPPAFPDDRCRWTREEYHRLGELNFFDNVRVELLDGEIWHIPTPTPSCITAICRAADCLEAAFGAKFEVRQRGPLVLNQYSEPEPDILVVPGSWRDYEDHHPTAAEVGLLIEVAEVSLEKDRSRKAKLYAAAGITDYWIINLVDRQLEIHRDPVLLSDGYGYKSRQVSLDGDTVTPLSASGTPVAVADLFPRITPP